MRMAPSVTVNRRYEMEMTTNGRSVLAVIAPSPFTIWPRAADVYTQTERESTPTALSEILISRK